MYTFALATKLVGESRIEQLDVSSLLGPTDTLISASATCAVYSGTDNSPSSVVGSCTIDSTYNLVNLPLNAVGVAGCIYQLVVTVVISSGNKTMTGFLVVMPDAV